MNCFEEKEMTVDEFKELLEKEGGVYEIECPTGWELVNEFYDHGERNSVEFEAEDKKIICSEDHLFFGEEDWTKAIDFNIGDIVRTKDGLKKVTNINKIGKVHVYDIWINSIEHAYYSNDFISHNCGKSSIIPHIRRELSGISVVAAYTGKAVVALKRKGITDALTLHSFVYHAVVENVGKKKKVSFVEKSVYSFGHISYLIVDEASMVDKEMYSILMKHPYKIIFIGDHFQLPPVNSNFNIMENPHIVLTEIIRQVADNPIIRLAELARNGKNIPFGAYGKSKKVYGYKDKLLLEYSQIITWSNDSRTHLNNTIRSIKGYDGMPPMSEEKMIVKMNNRVLGIFNGQIVYLTRDAVLKHENKNRFYLLEFIDELAHDDIIAMVKTPEPVKCFSTVGLDREAMNNIKSDFWQNKRSKFHSQSIVQSGNNIKYENLAHLDYGYAITCHAAQGSSWENVCVIDDIRFRRFDSYYRWLYTAITRAEETVTICTIGE